MSLAHVESFWFHSTNSPCSLCFLLRIVPPSHLKPQAFVLVFTIQPLFLLRFSVFHPRLYFCFLETHGHIMSVHLRSEQTLLLEDLLHPESSFQNLPPSLSLVWIRNSLGFWWVPSQSCHTWSSQVTLFTLFLISWSFEKPPFSPLLLALAALSMCMGIQGPQPGWHALEIWCISQPLQT